MSKLIKKSIAMLLMCVMLLSLCACASSDKTEVVSATVIGIEKYGHAVLNITTADFMNHGYELGDVVSVKFGSYKYEELTRVDLEAAVTKYLSDAGMADSDILALKEKLS